MSHRYENEQPLKKAVQEEINSLFKVIDDANLTKTELEEQMEDMRAELRNLEHEHEQVLNSPGSTCQKGHICSHDLSNLLTFQDVRVLYNQMAGREVDEPDAPIETSLDQILAYIRSHWEKVTEKNRAETDCYLDRKVSRVACAGVLTPQRRRLMLLPAGGAVCEQQTESWGGTAGGA